MSEFLDQSRTHAVCDNVAFSSSEKLLFYDVNFSIRSGESVAVVGAGGSGKSVLLKLLLGLAKPQEGSAFLTKQTIASYVPQEIESLGFGGNSTVRQLFYSARGLDRIESSLRELENKMASNSSPKILNEYSLVTEQFEKLRGYSADSNIGNILSGLGVQGHISLDTKVGEISSGQQTKILLGQALFANSSLLVIDDPTSHLDRQSTLWLASYLKQTKQGALVATSSPQFLNAFATRVIEITNIGRVIVFEGNYDQFTQKRDMLFEAERVAAEQKKHEIDRLRTAAKRFKTWGRETQETARKRKTIERRAHRQEEELAEMPGAHQTHEHKYRLQHFEVTSSSGKDVVRIKEVVKKYDNGFEALNLHDVDITLRRGERMAITGKNGAGKSTLLRLIAHAHDGQFATSFGQIDLGANITIGYYAPDKTTELLIENTILNEATEHLNTADTGRVRSVLGYWGFSGEEIMRKKVKDLSASQKSQLLLAKIMLQRPNLLILDEPTSNLSPSIVENLVSSLSGYQGTVLVVSHEHSFLDKIDTHRHLSLPSGHLKIVRELH